MSFFLHMYYATHIRTKPTHTCIRPHFISIQFDIICKYIFFMYTPPLDDDGGTISFAQWQSKPLTRKSNSHNNNNNDTKNEIHQWEMSNNVFRWQDTSTGTLNMRIAHTSPATSSTHPFRCSHIFPHFFRSRSNRHHTNVLENTAILGYRKIHMSSCVPISP